MADPTPLRVLRLPLLVIAVLASVSSGALRAQGSPRLVPINFTPITGTSYCAGASVTLTYDVCNNGSAPVFPNVRWTDQIVISPTRSGGTNLRTINRFTGAIGMPAGACYSGFNPPINLPSSVTIPSNLEQGTYQLGYRANANGALPGATVTTWVEITVLATPNLTGSELAVGNAPLLPGGGMQVSFRMNNLGGTCRHGSVVAALFIAPRGSGTGIRVGGSAPTFVSAGGSVRMGGTVTIPPSLPFGEYDLQLLVDETNLVVESDENDNLSVLPICIGPLAELVAYGAGCRGPAGQTLQTQVAPLPRPGASLAISVQGASPGLLGLLLVGLAPGAVDLGPIGMPGCLLLAAPLDSFGGLADAGGRLPFALSLPVSSGILGASLFVQPFAQMPGANALGFIAGDGTELRIGC